MGLVSAKLKELDLIGGEFNFSVKKHKRHITCISCTASFCIYLICLIVSVKLFIDYFTTTDPKITQTFSNSKSYPEIDIYKNNLSYAFLLSDHSGKEVSSMELFNYITPIVRLTKIKDRASDGSLDRDEDIFKFSPCRSVEKSKDQGINTIFFAGPTSMKLSNNGACMIAHKPELYRVKGQIDTEGSYDVNILIYPCTKATGCIRDPVKFKNLRVIVTKIVAAFDPENKNRPVNHFVSMDEIYSFDVKQALEINQVLQRVQIFDNRIDFVGSQSSDEFLQINSVSSARITRDSVNEDAECTIGSLASKDTLCPMYFSF